MSWDEWSAWFGLLFGLSEKQAPTLAVWVREVFTPGGATPDELKDATLDVARSGPPRFLNEILAALMDALRQRRIAEAMARQEQDRQGKPVVGRTHARCELCDGTGLVSVPHHPQPDYAQRKGYLIECYVGCSCAAGVRASAYVDHRKRQMMNLAAYEQLNPDWKAQLEWHHQRALAESQVESGFGKDMRELIERLKKSHAKGGRR